ncbi:chromatin assembly factor 1 subunit p50 [[Candida] railenensis]|uniref:Chromatin assembly factor 1 subunit p50 n=1 Tax=[Candida] railenensis TaxID=45579 RepID=A0A9P0QQW7_9ASCO|nr:chromatin assembly factor 1 subunit p50 [[Candida] railenensis]
MSDLEEVDVSPIDEGTQENYRTWKKNAPFLYDYLSTTSLLWPSLSVQFFPELESKKYVDKGSASDIDLANTTSGEEVGVSYHRLLIGTFTLNQAKVDSVSILRLPFYTDLNKRIDINKLNYTPERGEFELSTVTKKKVQVLQKINHMGDVNRAKYMPQNPDLIASSNNMGDIVVYDRTKHPNFKIGIDDSVNKPELRLRRADGSGDSDIFAIDWNKQAEGILVSGDIDGRINLYDIKRDFNSKDQEFINSSSSYETPGNAGVNDTEWIPNHDSIFSTVDESGWLRLYDIRTSTQDPTFSVKLGNSGVNSVCTNPGNSSYIATGDSDGLVSVLDVRTQEPVDTLSNVFESSITQLKWHNTYHNILTGSSTDKSIKILDLAKEHEERVLFAHGGHMLGVNDFDWCLQDDWLISSVADDNSLHVWKPSSKIVKEYSST